MLCLDMEHPGNWDKSVAKIYALRISQSVNCSRSWSLSLSFVRVIPKSCNVDMLSLGLFLLICCVGFCASMDVIMWSFCTCSIVAIRVYSLIQMKVL